MKALWRIAATVLAACLLAAGTACSPSPAGPAGAAASAASEVSVKGSSGAPVPGSYAALVSLEGGSGKVWVESPAALAVEADGSMMATVVWSSSNYDLMVVDGVEYRPVATDPASTFEVPVAALDEDLPMQAETTAMGQPHLIDYTLRFSLEPDDVAEGAAAKAGDDAAGASVGAAAQAVGLPSASLGNGWEPVASMPLEHATQFAVDTFEGGYKLLRIADGQRFLLVPPGKQVPTDLAADIVTLQQPLDSMYLAASDAMCLFDALDALDSISVSGIARDNWSIEAAVAAMDSGRMAYGGKYNMPDYDTLLAKGCRLALESTMINHTPDVRDKLIELGIPVLTERSSYEGDPLGRTEWIKLYGAMLDKEEEAARLFEAQVAKAQAVGNADTGKTVAYFYINSNGAAVVRKPGDYVTKMIDLAGGDYVFKSLGDDSASSTVTMEMERFYAEAKDADVVIYNATIDAGVDSLDTLLKKNSLLANFKAVRNGDVWATKQNMYQQMMNTGDIISDFNAALTGQAGELTYLEKLAG